MKHPVTRVATVAVVICASGLFVSPTGAQSQSTAAQGAVSARAAQQIAALMREKAARTPAQRKVSTRLLAAARVARGQSMVQGAPELAPRFKVDPDAAVEVDIVTTGVSKDLVELVEKLRGTVVYGAEGSAKLRARLPLDALESVAERGDVRAIRPAALAMTHRQLTREHAARDSSRAVGPDFSRRADRVRERLQTAVPALQRAAGPVTNAGPTSSAGDTAHRAAEARTFFGVSGAGVSIGVLSDSVDFLAASQASGELPADVTVLPGQSGVPGSGEGTAMLEIVHDVAPGAKLFFATAFTSDESFADNIRALAAAGCQIIVDDVIYFNESPFQDGIIAKAVQDVTEAGVLYFSSAGNEGNLNDGTSGVWQGDFKNGGTLSNVPGGNVHDFGARVISNRVETANSFVAALYWSDRLGESGNDYDLFILNASLSEVEDASTDVQDGDDDPFEIVAGPFAGERVVVLKATDADRRAIHLNLFGGQFGLATAGQTHGHSAVAQAFSVAAIDAALADGGAFTGGPTNPVEVFSADGPRRIFFDWEGTAYTPGKFLFSTGGGEVRNKPDITAADGVATSVPGFAPFFGTSASAPHAAAVAGLLKSSMPRITAQRVRRALTRTALDIEAVGRDRDSGHGVVDAFAALEFIGAAPAPFLSLGEVTAVAAGGDGDAVIEPGESAEVTVGLVNIGGATALDVSGTISTSTPGVTVTAATSPYPNIGSNGQEETNTQPFAFALAENAVCGVAPTFTIDASYSNGINSPQTFEFRVPTGAPGMTPATVSYTGPAVPIPDANPAGVSIPLAVSGITGSISETILSIDGATCSSAAGATGVGIDHTWVGDLIIRLTSPGGTSVVLAARPGSSNNSGNNFCQTRLDDAAAASIQTIVSGGAPYTGSFQPANPLAGFVGEAANGTWTLNVSDNALVDTGNVRAFSLTFKTFECSTPAPLTTTTSSPASLP